MLRYWRTVSATEGVAEVVIDSTVVVSSVTTMLLVRLEAMVGSAEAHSAEPFWPCMASGEFRVCVLLCFADSVAILDYKTLRVLST